MKRTVCTACILLSVLLSVVVTGGEKSEISAKSAIVAEVYTGTVLYRKDESRTRPMASTTKIMTALIAIENASLTDVYTVTAQAATVGGSQLGLLEGEKIPLEDLLYMLMLKSANDAAETIANGVAGSLEKFVELMNRKASQLGCENTHFVNPHGMPDPDHYTTASDLATIASEAWKNPTFRQIVGSEKHALKGYHRLVIKNSNKLLRSYEYCVGGKTGFTKEAGRCLVCFAQKDGVTLVTVTLCDPNDWDDHARLFEECFGFVSRVKMYDTGEFWIQAPVLGSHEGQVRLINTEPIYIILFEGIDVNYGYRIDTAPYLFAPLKAGECVGNVTVQCNNRDVCAVPLAVSETVEEEQVQTDFFSLFLLRLKRLFSLVV